MAGKPNKTRSTAVSVDDFLASVTPESRRADALALREMIARLTGEPARMWGPSIVGFGVRKYRYESGLEGEILRVGFSPRKPATVLYVTAQAESNPAVAALGKVKTGKGCIYVRSLADIDLERLERLISDTLARQSGAPPWVRASRGAARLFAGLGQLSIAFSRRAKPGSCRPRSPRRKLQGCDDLTPDNQVPVR